MVLGNRNLPLRWDAINNQLQVFAQGVWQCITPVESTVATSETTGSTTYVALTTAQSVALLCNTIIEVTVTCAASANVADYCFMSAAASGPATVAASDTWSTRIVSVVGGYIQRQSAVSRMPGLTAGLNTISAQHRQLGASTGTYYDRGLKAVAIFA